MLRDIDSAGVNAWLEKSAAVYHFTGEGRLGQVLGEGCGGPGEGR